MLSKNACPDDFVQSLSLFAHALDDNNYKQPSSELPKNDEAIKFLKDQISVLERWEATNEAALKRE